MTQPVFTAPADPKQEDTYVPANVPRDAAGRPKILQPGGGKPVPYTRISTLCKALDDPFGLPPWYGRMTALGIARRPDLLAYAATLTSSPADKAELNKLVDEAMEAAGSSTARNMGSALHRLTEKADSTSEDLTGTPPQMLADLDAYMQATAALEVVAVERFVVVDEVQAAGTFDRLFRCPDGKIRVGDIKTGKDADRYASSTAVQCGLYANGSLYDATTGSRVPLTGVDTETAILIHLKPGQQECNLYLLDIRGAMDAARLAIAVRDFRKQTFTSPYTP